MKGLQVRPFKTQYCNELMTAVIWPRYIIFLKKSHKSGYELWLRFLRNFQWDSWVFIRNKTFSLIVVQKQLHLFKGKIKRYGSQAKLAVCDCRTRLSRCRPLTLFYWKAVYVLGFDSKYREIPEMSQSNALATWHVPKQRIGCSSSVTMTTFNQAGTPPSCCRYSSNAHKALQKQ